VEAVVKKFIFALMFALVSSSAFAQTTTDIVKDIVFSEIEKRVIRDHFGWRRDTDTTTKSDDAKSDDDKPRYGEWRRDDDKDDDDDHAKGHDDDDDHKGKKAKKSKKAKHKGKGKGKGKNKGMPPGLAKKDKLPKGLAMQLEKRGKLPPGLAKRDLPNDLEARLPEAPEGTERVIVDNDVVLTDVATGVVLDIIHDVIINR